MAHDVTASEFYITGALGYRRLCLRHCSCGYQASSPTETGVLEAMLEHQRHVQLPARLGPKAWALPTVESLDSRIGRAAAAVAIRRAL